MTPTATAAPPLPTPPGATGAVTRIHPDPEALSAEAWNGLLAQQARPTPFMRLEYLRALHSSGSAVPTTGWTPRFVTVEAPDGRLLAAAPAYLKTHSYGEYVFDWAWANAYRQHGLRYYPKLLLAVPFTPVPGSRLMAVDDTARQTLQQALATLAHREQVSSVHLLFHDEADGASTATAGWMRREGVQFHWTQRTEAPWPTFDALLASLQREKRKKIQQERRKVAEAGVHFTVQQGADIDDGLWDFFHQCYTLTYAAHHSTPYLTRAFFHRMAQELPQHWLMFVAWQGGQRVAASLVAIDPDSRQAWGRYWGATTWVPCLHFEACYYQPLAWCLANGYVRFEGGAQGEHKMARGLLPQGTASAHWLAHPEFARAVADFLAREGHGMAAYVDELREHSPFKGSS